jgi:hypothetical protein
LVPEAKNNEWDQNKQQMLDEASLIPKVGQNKTGQGAPVVPGVEI